VATNSEVLFQVVFTPSSGGLREARLRFDNNDPNENPFTFSIEGTGVGPEIGVSGAGTEIVDGSITPTTNNLTEFGGVLVGGSVMRTFVITNSGSTNLTVGTVTVGGANPAAFTVTSPPAATVAAGGSTQFQVTFSPSVANVRNATLSFTNSDFNEAPFDFAVRGAGGATALEVWRYNHFGTVTNTGSAANTADPDGDGLRNLMEFTLGDSPTRQNIDGVTVSNLGGVLSMYYPRATVSTNVTLRAWWATNLLTWSTNGITETKLSDDGTNQTWRAQVLKSGRTRLFLRLQSTDP
jgi:hypothetical protein